MPSVSSITRKNVLVFGISAITAYLVFLLVSKLLLFTVQRIELLGYIPNNTQISISNLSQNGQLQLLDEFDVVGSNELQRVGTGYINQHVNRLKIELKHPDEGLISLARIKIFFPYLEEYYFIEDRIPQFFSSPQSTEKSARQYEGKQIVITSNETIGRPTSIAPYLLSGLFFIGSLLLLRSTPFHMLPAFQDMSLGHRISSTAEFDVINGIRGLAALLVLLSHTAPGFEAAQIGLSLLFVISGFLLSKPFILDNKKIFSLANIERYLVKRLRRILPMYYAFVFIIFGASIELQTLLRHLVFLQGDGHLWPMPQIFAFYMLLPIVLLITSLSNRIHKVLPVIILTLGSFAAYKTLHGWEPFYNGRFHREFYLYAFLFGVLAAYIEYGELFKITTDKDKKTILPFKLPHTLSTNLWGITALSITVATIVWSAPIKPAPWIWGWLSQFWVKCILSAVIIFLAIKARDSFFRHIIGNWLFRSVGVIGFSFYLLHGLGMEIFTEIQRMSFTEGNTDANYSERSWQFSAGSFAVTYLLALLTYSYIERPFFGYRNHRAPKNGHH